MIRLKRYIAISFCILLNGLGVNCHAQNNPTIDAYWELRDYFGLIQEAQKKDSLSNQEWIYLAQSYYRVREFDRTRACIAQIEKKGIDDSRIHVLKNDVMRNQSRVVLIDEKFRTEELFPNAEKSRFLSFIDDSVFFLVITDAQIEKREKDNTNIKGLYEVYTGTGNLELNQDYTRVVRSRKHHSGPIVPFENGYWLTENYDQLKDRKFLRLTLLNQDFEKVDQFPFSNTHYSTGHACYDEITERLYFISDMPKGSGSTDLWYSERKADSTWGLPVRMNEVNTNGQEMFPTISDGYLYFSSNGREGYGGLDIYRFNLRKPFSAVEHLPGPINSKQDDFGVFWLNSEYGYFSSNRGASGMDNIYKVELETGEFGCAEECENESCRNFVIDGMTELDPTRYIFQWDFGDGSSEESWFPVHCYADTGKYQVRLTVVDKMTGYVDSNAMVKEVYIKNLSVNSPAFTLDKVSQGMAIQPELQLRLNNEIAEKSLWKSSAGHYELAENPKFTFDSVGWHWIEQSIQVKKGDDCCYNSYRKYFYVFKSLGAITSEEMSNLFNSNGDSDSAIVNGYSTTTEFHNVIEGEPLHLIIRNSSGKELLDTVIYSSQIRIRLQHDVEYDLEAVNIFGTKISTTLSSLGKTKLEYGHNEVSFKPFKLNGVQFASGKADLNTKSKATLDSLSGILTNYPNLVVELSAHTDSKGSANANMRLSERRADAVKQYLIRNGVNADQLVSEGYGEEDLLNNCMDGVYCSEIEHQKNRRVEARIIKLRK